jgi:hypothetical protein
MSHFKNTIFSHINAFAVQKTPIDWQLLWEDEELCGLLDDAFDTILSNIAYLEDVDAEVRQVLIGKITMNSIFLSFSRQLDDHKAFLAAGKGIEDALRTLVSSGSWFKIAQEKFESFETANLEEDVSFKQLALMRPFVLAIALVSVITLDRAYLMDEDLQEECESDCDDEYCENE